MVDLSEDKNEQQQDFFIVILNKNTRKRKIMCIFALYYQ